MKVVGEKDDAVTARPESYASVWILGWSQLLLDHMTEGGLYNRYSPKEKWGVMIRRQLDAG